MPAGVVQREAWKGRRERCQDSRQALCLDVWQGQLLKGVGDPDAFQCRLRTEQGVRNGQVALDLVLDDFLIHLELPFVDRACSGEAEADAVVLHEVVRMAGRGEAREIIRRGDDGDCDGAAKGKGDHVLVQIFSHANARIETPLDDVDEAFVIGQFKFHVRMLTKETCQQRLQHH
ncbi:hypothetical protein D3C75_845290 [compost metagenome]